MLIRHRKIYYFFSGSLVLISIAALAVYGLNLGIDFTGGSLLEIEFQGEKLSKQEIEVNLQDFALGKVSFQAVGSQGYILRFREISEQEHQDIKESLQEYKIIEKQFSTAGPIIGQELKQKALWAISFALLVILLYVAWAFRKVAVNKEFGRSWRYGLAAILALAHDIIITMGIFAILGHWLHWEIDLAFLAAILTILGYSVNDTIVVFDRLRENILQGADKDLEKVAEISLRQTMSRSINTSFTTLLALIAILLFGGQSLFVFVLALICGIVLGTYSSIFLAVPILVSWYKIKS